MGIDLRPIEESEAEAFLVAEGMAFGVMKDEGQIAIERPSLEFDRTIAAFDEGEIVASALAHSLELTLPGVSLAPAGGVSYVGVLPTHRRRGLLTEMMRRQLDDFRSRGDPFGVLTASESSIYRRFGYGPATYAAAYTIDKTATKLAPDVQARWPGSGGSVALVSLDEAAKVAPLVYDEARRATAGEVSRPDPWWPDLLRDDERRPGGENALFCALHTSPGGTVNGYALYRVRRRHGQAGPDPGTASVRELVATRSDVTAALFRFAASIDLTARMELWARPLSDPLRWMLDDPRRLTTAWQSDHLWLRLVDLARSLPLRAYDQTASLVLEVHDAFCPWNEGRWRLETGPDGAEARRARPGEAAELALGVSDLASLYLGATRVSTLAAAARVEELVPGAARRAGVLFATEEEPFCGTDF